jgi:hypothetical protein
MDTGLGAFRVRVFPDPPEIIFSSTRVSQAPHSGHRPIHLGVWQPQAWHKNVNFSFLLKKISSQVEINKSEKYTILRPWYQGAKLFHGNSQFKAYNSHGTVGEGEISTKLKNSLPICKNRVKRSWLKMSDLF